MTTMQETKQFTPELETLLNTFGDHENEGVILSKEFAINLINLRGGDNFYHAQYKNIANTAYGPKLDMSDDDQTAFFDNNKDAIETFTQAMFSQSITSSFIMYIHHQSNGSLSLDEVAKGVHECKACNEDPSYERLRVQNIMIYKCLVQLSSAYIWHLENTTTLQKETGSIIARGCKKYEIERIYVVNESNSSNKVNFNNNSAELPRF